MNPQVLICGAGPTGLMLALRLARAGVRLRIVDAAAEPGTTSRALVVHARTIEFYRQIGLAEAYLKEALPFVAANLWVRAHRVARVPVGDLGKGISPYPYLTVCPQDRHERFLIGQLERVGVPVERPVKLLGFEEQDDRVRATLLRADGTEESCEASYIAGCDGAHSRVREVLDVGFPGGTYAHFFYVADVEARGPVMNDELHAALDTADFLAIFPLMGGHTGRLIGTIQSEDEQRRESLRFEDVGADAIARLGVTVDRVNWFSTYRVHHRVAERFRRGRAFLLGDAAHIHSPAGGQGMNTGLGDAVNLAWKLADVLSARAKPSLLDSYEPERIAFARRLVNTTDRAFVIATSDGRLARFVRLHVVPRLVPRLFDSRALRRFMFRTISQTSIHYRGSPLSTGAAGAVHGGDRLPWVEAVDNFAALDGSTWQVHVYGTPAPGVEAACQRSKLALHAFTWQPAMRAAGLARDALYLVRPDGHVALAATASAPAALADYVARLAP
ncbi:MAG TPA: FAD-dependent monooxygenase [Candidatus Polarisedimenticolaceae bacterium]|nr:FAD-dependent monooxygenase [Candidatus Polarisedimenticolaceae bacterium]